MCMSLEEAAYQAYGESTDWKNFRGDKMPEWEELPEAIQEAWRIASVGSVKHWIETTFKSACLDNERLLKAGAMLKVANDKGDEPLKVLSLIIADFIRTLSMDSLQK